MTTKNVTMRGAATRTTNINSEIKGTLKSVNLTNQKLEVTDALRASAQLDVGPSRRTSISGAEALRLMDELKLGTRAVSTQAAEVVEIPINLRVQGEVTHNIEGLAEVLEKTALTPEGGATPVATPPPADPTGTPIPA